MEARIGSAQRDEVADLLSRALEEGYLDLSEYDQRVTLVHSAKTAAELTEQVSDLPPQFRWSPQQSVAVRSKSARDPNTHATSIASLVLAISSVPLAVCFGVGGLFGIAAVMLSRPGLRSRTDYGKALTGFVVGCLGIASSIAVIILFVLVPTSE